MFATGGHGGVRGPGYRHVRLCLPHQDCQVRHHQHNTFRYRSFFSRDEACLAHHAAEQGSGPGQIKI